MIFGKRLSPAFSKARRQRILSHVHETSVGGCNVKNSTEFLSYNPIWMKILGKHIEDMNGLRKDLFVFMKETLSLKILW